MYQNRFGCGSFGTTGFESNVRLDNIARQKKVEDRAILYTLKRLKMNFVTIGSMIVIVKGDKLLLFSSPCSDALPLAFWATFPHYIEYTKIRQALNHAPETY